MDGAGRMMQKLSGPRKVVFDAWVFDNTTQTLNVRFKSDSSVRSSGFLARFCFVPGRLCSMPGCLTTQRRR